MNKQKGFTLIELVVVIIILGILAVTALPKFVNLQGEAQAAALQGLKGALEGGATLVYSKAAIQGKDAACTTPYTVCSEVNLGKGATGDEIDAHYGYPVPTAAVLAKVLDTTFGANGDWSTNTPADVADPILIYPTARATGWTAADNCHVSYAAATATARPVITVVSTGC